MQQSFASLELSAGVKRNGSLMKVRELIDWESLRPSLKGLSQRELSHAGGQEPFDAVMMFKVLLLGQWHSLSDAKLEEACRPGMIFEEKVSADQDASWLKKGKRKPSQPGLAQRE